MGKLWPTDLVQSMVLSEWIGLKLQIFYKKKIFLLKREEKKINPSLFLMQILTHIVFCIKNGWGTINIKLLGIF